MIVHKDSSGYTSKRSTTAQPNSGSKFIFYHRKFAKDFVTRHHVGKYIRYAVECNNDLVDNMYRYNSIVLLGTWAFDTVKLYFNTDCTNDVTVLFERWSPIVFLLHDCYRQT